MQITLGPITRTAERFPGDKLAHNTADLLVDGEKIGAIHDNGYAPRWAFHISPYRNRPDNTPYHTRAGDYRSPFYGLLFDGATFESAEVALAKVQVQVARFEALKAVNPK
jgi:hypothetical protein